MNLPAIITNLFDTAARRRDNLRSLDAKLAELREAYERAIEAGDDAEADKIAAKMMRAEVEARGARLAVETAERQAAERQAAQDAAVRELRVREHAERQADSQREAREFEALVTVDVLNKWRRVVAAAEVERAAAAAAGVPRCAETPSKVWAVVFSALQQATHAHGKAPMTWPPPRSASRAVVTLAERFARTEPAADQPQEAEEEAHRGTSDIRS